MILWGRFLKTSLPSSSRSGCVVTLGQSIVVLFGQQLTAAIAFVIGFFVIGMVGVIIEAIATLVGTITYVGVQFICRGFLGEAAAAEVNGVIG